MSVEPLLILDGDGCDISMSNGSTFDVDQVFNTVLILLFCSDDNGHYDIFLRDKNWRFRGNYMRTVQQPINIQMLGDLGKAVESDLKPLTDGGYISNLSSVSSNPTGKRINTVIQFVYNGEPIKRSLVYDGQTVEIG